VRRQRNDGTQYFKTGPPDQPNQSAEKFLANLKRGNIMIANSGESPEAKKFDTVVRKILRQPIPTPPDVKRK
jgi:hypothetical protein